MTRAECEAKLMEHLEAMATIVREYSPQCTYLAASWSENEKRSFFSINNEYFNPDSPDHESPVHCHKYGSGELISD